MYYILDGHKIIPVNNVYEWSKWFEKADREVALTEKEGIKVSTVFLGLNHAFDNGPPLLFETMVFGGKHDGDMDRYYTWEEAELGHKKMCERIFGRKP